MTESSIPWGGTVTGDCGPYSDDQWSDIWRDLFVSDPTTQGVIAGVLNDLANLATVTPNAVKVNTGAALVDGKFYKSDVAVEFVLPIPGVATRIDRIVLMKTWATQQVRLMRLAGVEGGSAPSYAAYQVDGVTWAIPILQASITTGGVVTVTDERRFVRAKIGPGYEVATLAASVTPVSIGVNSVVKMDLEPGTYLVEGWCAADTVVSQQRSIIVGYYPVGGAGYPTYTPICQSFGLTDITVPSGGNQIIITTGLVPLTLAAASTLEMFYFAARTDEQIWGTDAGRPSRLIAIRVA